MTWLDYRKKLGLGHSDEKSLNFLKLKLIIASIMKFFQVQFIYREVKYTHFAMK